MIRIVTDSLCDLPVEIYEELNIAFMPSYVSIGGKVYRDHVEISPTHFYEMLPKQKDLPTTTQASVEDFLQLYRRVLEESPGATILSIHLAEALSGTLASARQAAAMLPEASIKLFDTQLASLGEGLIVREAAAMVRAGESLEPIIGRMTAMRESMQSYYTVDTLNYLYMGGRIGRAALFMGTLLDMKPILTFNNGAVAPFERHRSRERAIARMEEVVVKAGEGKKNIRLAVVHAAAEVDAQNLADRLKEALKPEVVILSQIGPAIGTYTGPRSLGTFMWGE